MKRILILIITLAILISGCTTDTVDCTGDTCSISSIEPAEVQKVEIYHFHATTQCYSCKTVGALAEKTIDTYFSEEVKSGKVVFAHINGELPENRELVQKYGVTGSSLWIGVYDSNGFHKEENVNVWYKISNELDYTTYLKSIIDKRLQGDFS